MHLIPKNRSQSAVNSNVTSRQRTGQPIVTIVSNDRRVVGRIQFERDAGHRGQHFRPEVGWMETFQSRVLPLPYHQQSIFVHYISPQCSTASRFNVYTEHSRTLRKFLRTITPRERGQVTYLQISVTDPHGAYVTRSVTSYVGSFTFDST